MAVQRTLIGNIKGPKGDKGDTGNTGARGAAGTISVGSVTTTAYGGSASVTNSGTSTDAVFDFVIPQGRPGEQVTDMQDLTLSSLTQPSTQFPTPSIGDTGKVLWGKVVKWFSDMTTLVNSKLNTANVANNLTTTESGYALDARTGPVLYEMIGTKLANTTSHRYMANGRSGIPWSSTMKDAIVVVEFGLNTEVKVQFYICQEMLQSVSNRLMSGAYKSSSDNHCVIVTYNKDNIRLTNWYYNGTDISTSDSSLCALHVYEHI